MSLPARDTESACGVTRDILARPAHGDTSMEVVVVPEPLWPAVPPGCTATGATLMLTDADQIPHCGDAFVWPAESL